MQGRIRGKLPQRVDRFVVREEATHGIHTAQFYNALQWIAILHPKIDDNRKRLAILGPTFSGSLPSVAAALNAPELTGAATSDPRLADLHLEALLNLKPKKEGLNVPKLAIYSGSVSSNISAQVFQTAFAEQVRFHSFVQNDDEILRRFCAYM